MPVKVIPALLGILCLLSSLITTVGTKDAGVVTTFGKPTGRDLENGLHLKAPWQKVTELDGAINPDDYSGHSCINVRIGDYRSNDVNATVRTSLVKTQFNAALNDVLGTFNPLQSTAAQAAPTRTWRSPCPRTPTSWSASASTPWRRPSRRSTRCRPASRAGTVAGAPWWSPAADSRRRQSRSRVAWSSSPS